MRDQSDFLDYRQQLHAHGDVQGRSHKDLFFVARFSFWKPSSRERAVRQALCNELQLLRWSPRTHSSLVDRHQRGLVVIHRLRLEVQGLAQFLPQLKSEARKTGMESRLGRPDLADHMIGRTTARE